MTRQAGSAAECLTATDICWYIGKYDVQEFLWSLPPQSVDLIFGSPPYEARRTYGIGFSLSGEAWVSWMVEVYMAALRACRGLVAFVVEGSTERFRYSAVPALLMADLHRKGVCLRKPPAFYRHGIPGSGGTDWWRNDWEFVVCATNGGKLPWSDATACGSPPRWAPGGEMSYRACDGARRNRRSGRDFATLRHKGSTSNAYIPPKLANPGNVIACKVGGGRMGSMLAHDNEAPFPESLAERFVCSFSPPGGCVIDPFCGSATTGAVSIMHGRKFLGCDIRDDQVELGCRRMNEANERLKHASAENAGRPNLGETGRGD